MFEVLTLKSLGLEVTGMRKWLDIVEHVVPIFISYKMNSIYKRIVSKFYNFLMFEVVTSKNLGLEVTGMKKVTWYCWTCSPYSHIIQNEQYLLREMFRNSTISSIFEVVTLKSFGLEVTGMRKWLDIVEHVVPIVISYKMNSIYKRNVSENSTISLCLR